MKLRQCAFASLTLIAIGVHASEKLTIADFVELGFTKSQQQLFTMIGAEDGWSGVFEGEVIELYQYRDDETLDQFKQTMINAASPGNASGWVDYCVRHNLLIISKGFTACKALKKM